MTPFQAYELYLAIKTHFCSKNYDFFKYGGKINTHQDSFNKRKDKHYFLRLARHPDARGLLIASFSSGTATGWIGSIFSEQSLQAYQDYNNRIQSLSYRFDLDIKTISQYSDGTFAERFKVVGGQYPDVLKLLKQDRIGLETFCILNDIIRFIPIWDQKIQDTVIWPTIRDRVIKYTSFIEYDKKNFVVKVKDIVREDK